VPAIRPRAGITAPETPAFSAQDVQQYIAKNPLHGKIGAAGATNVVKIEFLTAQAVDTMLNTTTAPLPADRLLCVVELSGSFVTSGPPRQNASVTTYKTAYIVFDAHSGNEVLETVQ
jgi:hypothetical protein